MAKPLAYSKKKLFAKADLKKEKVLLKFKRKAVKIIKKIKIKLKKKHKKLKNWIIYHKLRKKILAATATALPVPLIKLKKLVYRLSFFKKNHKLKKYQYTLKLKKEMSGLNRVSPSLEIISERRAKKLLNLTNLTVNPFKEFEKLSHKIKNLKPLGVQIHKKLFIKKQIVEKLENPTSVDFPRKLNLQMAQVLKKCKKIRLGRKKTRSSSRTERRAVARLILIRTPKEDEAYYNIRNKPRRSVKRKITLIEKLYKKVRRKYYKIKKMYIKRAFFFMRIRKLHILKRKLYPLTLKKRLKKKWVKNMYSIEKMEWNISRYKKLKEKYIQKITQAHGKQEKHFKKQLKFKNQIKNRINARKNIIKNNKKQYLRRIGNLITFIKLNFEKNTLKFRAHALIQKCKKIVKKKIKTKIKTELAPTLKTALKPVSKKNVFRLLKRIKFAPSFITGIQKMKKKQLSTLQLIYNKHQVRTFWRLWTKYKDMAEEKKRILWNLNQLKLTNKILTQKFKLRKLNQHYKTRILRKNTTRKIQKNMKKRNIKARIINLKFWSRLVISLKIKHKNLNRVNNSRKILAAALKKHIKKITENSPELIPYFFTQKKQLSKMILRTPLRRKKRSRKSIKRKKKIYSQKSLLPPTYRLQRFWTLSQFKKLLKTSYYLHVITKQI